MIQKNKNNVTGQYIDGLIKAWKQIYPLIIGISVCLIILAVGFLVLSPVKSCDCSNPLTQKCIDFCSSGMTTLAQPEVPVYIVLIVILSIMLFIFWWVNKK